MIAVTFTAAPPVSIVPADTRLFAPEGHGMLWLALGVVALLAGGVLTVVALRPLWRDRRQTTLSPLEAAKARHLAHIDMLETAWTAGRLEAREVHHELSRTMRHFARDLGASGAPAMSVRALRTAGLGPVATVVHGYELPQFHPDPDRDPIESFTIARAAIAAWHGDSTDPSSAVPSGACR